MGVGAERDGRVGVPELARNEDDVEALVDAFLDDELGEPQDEDEDN